MSISELSESGYMFKVYSQQYSSSMERTDTDKYPIKLNFMIMHQKEILDKQFHARLTQRRNSWQITNTLLYTGLALILASLIYMIIHLEKADAIIVLWLPFIFSGVSLVLLSTIFSRQKPGMKSGWVLLPKQSQRKR
jgi:hypothetical protein